MKRWILITVFLGVGVTLMLAAVGAAWYATMRIPANGGSLERALLVAGDVFLGVLLLVAAVYFAVHVGVRFFARDSEPPA